MLHAATIRLSMSSFLRDLSAANALNENLLNKNEIHRHEFDFNFQLSSANIRLPRLRHVIYFLNKIPFWNLFSSSPVPSPSFLNLLYATQTLQSTTTTAGAALTPTPGTQSPAPSSALASTCPSSAATSPGSIPAASRCPAFVPPPDLSLAADRVQTPLQLSTKYAANSRCSVPTPPGGCSGSSRIGTRTRAAPHPHLRQRGAMRTWEEIVGIRIELKLVSNLFSCNLTSTTSILAECVGQKRLSQ